MSHQLAAQSILDEFEIGQSRRALHILEAACVVICRDSAYGLRMDAVAREAGVSKALVHYYFSTRRALIRAAFRYGELQARLRIEPELSLLESSAERLERFLLAYLDDEPVLNRYRMLWSEAWSSMRLDEELRPDIEELYRHWVEWLRDLIEEAAAEGSLAPDTAADELTWRLTALVDGLDSLILVELLSSEQARQLIRDALSRERSDTENAEPQERDKKEAQP